MDGDPDTLVLKDFVNGRLSLDQLPSIQNYLKSNPDVLERLESIEDDSFVKAFRESARSASHDQQPPLSSQTNAPHVPRKMPVINDYRFVTLIKEHDLVLTWAAWLDSSVSKSAELNSKRVIIKVFHRSDRSALEDLERFHREAETLRRLDHPNIVRYVDSKCTSNYSYLTMEYLEGIDLSRMITSQGPLPLGTVATIATQILHGLNYLYEQKVIHRDIKPSNIMLCSDGVVRLIDFGLAQLFMDSADKSLTRSEQFLGTIDYVSPEQAMEPTSADTRSDLYSLGCTLFKLLTGNAPFSNRSFDNPLKKVVAHALAQPPKLNTLCKDLPDDFCDCIEKFLAKKPADRYQTPAEAINALAPWCDPSALPAMHQSIQHLVQKRHDDLWKINSDDLRSSHLRSDSIAKRIKSFLYIASLSVASLSGILFFSQHSWFSSLKLVNTANTPESGLKVRPFGSKESNTPADSASKGAKQVYLREGYYLGEERNLRDKAVQKAGIIISDDIFAYTTADNAPPGQLRRLGCLWTRIHNHELEREGKFVYVEQPAVSGYLILEVISETEFKATCWRGPNFTLSKAIDDPSVGYFHSTIEAKWWSIDTLFVGPALQLNKEIADDWPTFLSKYAPRCVPEEKRRRP